MTTSVESETDIESSTPKRKVRWLRWVLLAVLLIVLALGGFAAWLAAGLKSAATAVKTPATAARSDLTAMKTALLAGDQVAAKASLASAHTNIDAADHAARRTPIRIAAKLPVLSGPVDDLGHLLAAAHDLVSAGDEVTTLYDGVSGADSKLFNGSAFNLDEVHSADQAVQRLMALLDSAEGRLHQVKGGALAPGAIEARDSALAQITTLRKDAQPLIKILAVLPQAIGEKKPVTYLIVMQNQAELRAGGGAPLSLTAMKFDHGAMELLPTAHTLDIDGNVPLQWTAVKGNDAWHAPGTKMPFANANFAPDWPTSGEELLRAYEAMTRTHADGVIGVDITAMAAVLKITQPLETSGYGTVTADNLVQTLLIDSYRKFPDTEERHRNNEQVMSALVSNLMRGGQISGKVRALAATSPGHHTQMYFRDPQVQSLIDATPTAGHLNPGTDDFAAVYTTNTNASKVDVWQSRQIAQDVVIQADGSAKVTRSVTITNKTPPYRGSAPRDPGKGYDTTVSRPSIAMYVPPGARVKGFDVKHSAKATISPRPYAMDRKMWVMRVAANLPRSHAVTATVQYLTRPVANRSEYRLRIVCQPTLAPTEMTVSVTLPAGYVGKPAGGWVQDGNKWTATLAVTGDVDIVLPFTRG